MSDRFENTSAGLESPATHIEPITPDDANDLNETTRALHVAGSGFVRITTVSGSQGTVFMPAGAIFPIRARRVWATGTDATGIVGLS